MTKHFHHSNTFHIITNTIFRKRSELISSLILMFSLLMICATGVFFAENETQPEKFSSIPSAMWWAVATLTTVGYGDFTPHTFLGRLFAIIIMLSGISLIAIITGTISSIFTSKRIMEDRGLEKINLSGHIVLCGWNTNAQNIINNLVEHNKNLNFVLINEEL